MSMPNKSRHRRLQLPVAPTSYRVPRYEPSLPLHYDVGRELHVLSPCGHGVRPSHGVRRRSAWPLRRDGGRRAYDVQMPSCEVRSAFLDIVIFLQNPKLPEYLLVTAATVNVS
jgi:hypothetical protein